MPALRKIGYRGKSTLKLLKELREFDIPGKLTVERIRASVEKLDAKSESPETKKASTKKKKSSTRDDTDVKIKKAPGLRKPKPKPKPFKHNEITFGKVTTPGYEIFSNMHVAPVYCLVNDAYIMFYSAEQAFQYMKTESAEHRTKIRNCIKPKDARYQGSAKAGCPLRDDWDEVKESIMFEILKAKYSQNVVMGEMLMGTEDVPIVEIAPWDKEKFWGVDTDRQGKNTTGKLHERVRKWLRKKKGTLPTIQYYTAELNDSA